MLKVFIGFDSREPVAYHVAAHSILTTASQPVAIIPLVQSQLRTSGLYTRERGATEATEFSMTRFLVPYLSGYEGISVFMDCDMVVRSDITQLAAQSCKTCWSVAVAKHNYVPKSAVKMDGQTQTTYPRKNWSSLIVFNNARCQSLTPEYVNTASGLDLHRLNWTEDAEIASLALEWNWLVDEYPHNDRAKILHYTNGGPWFTDYRKCDHAADWEQVALSAGFIASRDWVPDDWHAQADGVP